MFFEYFCEVDLALFMFYILSNKCCTNAVMLYSKTDPPGTLLTINKASANGLESSGTRHLQSQDPPGTLLTINKASANGLESSGTRHLQSQDPPGTLLTINQGECQWFGI